MAVIQQSLLVQLPAYGDEETFLGHLGSFIGLGLALYRDPDDEHLRAAFMLNENLIAEIKTLDGQKFIGNSK